MLGGVGSESLCATTVLEKANRAQMPSIALRTSFREGVIINTSNEGGAGSGRSREVVPVSVCIGTSLIGTSDKIEIIRILDASYPEPSYFLEGWGMPPP